MTQKGRWQENKKKKGQKKRNRTNGLDSPFSAASGHRRGCMETLRERGEGTIFHIAQSCRFLCTAA